MGNVLINYYKKFDQDMTCCFGHLDLKNYFPEKPFIDIEKGKSPIDNVPKTTDTMNFEIIDDVIII